jgi:hypothetical protein
MERKIPLSVRGVGISCMGQNARETGVPKAARGEARTGFFEKERVRGFGRRGKQELVSPPPESCE